MKIMCFVLAAVCAVLSGCSDSRVTDAPVADSTKSATPAKANEPAPKVSSVDACAASMLNVARPTKEWEQEVKSQCLALDEATQIKAAYLATLGAGGAVQFWQASNIVGDFEKGRLPYLTSHAARAEEWLALQGNYQAQRNFAYSLSQELGNQIGACAWRLVILKSGSPKVDTTDVSNVEIHCGKLSALEQEAAASRFEAIHKEMDAVARGQFPSWLHEQIPSDSVHLRLPYGKLPPSSRTCRNVSDLPETDPKDGTSLWVCPK